MIQSFGMTYSELALNLNQFTKAGKSHSKGNELTWVNETRRIANEVYSSAKQTIDSAITTCTTILPR